MGFLEWWDQNWFVLLQSAGIVGSLLFTAASFRLDFRARRAENLLTIANAHRDVWERIYRNSQLTRVLDPQADPHANPPTKEEEIFVMLLVLHLDTVLQTAEYRMFELPSKVSHDIREFFAMPIPRYLWPKLKPFIDEKTVRVVETQFQD